ncbi:MAG: hypothetical protein LBQ12_03905, partial [Deltaproteobacteria bacterium]|nr:hypothetical protein [Deltaproteobacteria bacterium]
MTIDSVNFVAGRILGFGKLDDSPYSPIEVTLSGPDSGDGLPRHRVLIFDFRKAEEFLRANGEKGEVVIAETRYLRFEPSGSGCLSGSFISHLTPMGVLEIAPGIPPSSLHFIKAKFAGSAHSPGGGIEVQLKTSHSVPQDDMGFLFSLRGRQIAPFNGAKLARGAEIFVRTFDVRPCSLAGDGSIEFTGTGFEFFPLGAGQLRPADPVRNRRRPAAERAAKAYAARLATGRPAVGLAVAASADDEAAALNEALLAEALEAAPVEIGREDKMREQNQAREEPQASEGTALEPSPDAVSDEAGVPGATRVKAPLTDDMPSNPDRTPECPRTSGEPLQGAPRSSDSPLAEDSPFPEDSQFGEGSPFP